jgi:short subunit dehydrogenase-like uncharacterized protein
MLVESALSLSLDHEDLPPIGQQGGLLTPATAMGDVLVKRLQKNKLFNLETMEFQEWEMKESRKQK